MAALNRTIATLLIIVIFPSILTAQLRIDRSVIGSGYTQATDSVGEGLTSENANFLDGTIGQAFISKSADSTFSLGHGFWYQISRDIMTGIEEDLQTPETFELKQNYPNPFNPSTTIVFTVPKAATVRLSIYNVLGQEVGTLVDEKLAAGKYDIKFEARGLAAGLYFYRIQADGFVETKKMLLVK
ncbi:MAG: T9SS type A sorting domain-containing protein [Calditrichia bacterium]